METASPETLWNEVTAERAGSTPAKPVEKPAPVAAVTEPVVETAKPDPLAEITARLAEFENKLGTRLRNVEGHIGNLNGTQKELKTLMEASKTAANSVGQAPTQSEVKAAAGNPKAWEDLKGDYPEWANATEALLDSRLTGANTGFDAKAFEAEIKQQMRGETEAVRKEIINSSLDAVFPGWKEVVQSEAFDTWQAVQPEAVRALARSEKVGDAAKMLKMYETARLANPSNAITEQRKQTLAAATSTPKGIRTSTTQKAWADMTMAERWDYEKRQRAKKS